MDRKVFDFLKDEFSLVLGDSLNAQKNNDTKFDYKGTTFWIHPEIDLANRNTISFISIRFLTENKSELIEALYNLCEFFDLKGVPDVNMDSQFYTTSSFLLAVDPSTGEELQLTLRDRISSMLSRYEIELKIGRNI